jgi:hypothetical protein
MVQWNNGSMEQWFNGTMVQWNNGSMEQWFNGINGTMQRGLSSSCCSSLRYYVVLPHGEHSIPMHEKSVGDQSGEGKERA